MLLHSASQVITVKGGPQKGGRLGELGLVPNGAILYRNGIIEEIGNSDDMLARYPNEEAFSANQCAVLPGFVDAHTHLVWAGDRAAEFEMRLQGKSYMEIMAAGGGIQSTVNSTREASMKKLMEESSQRARGLFRHGTTTVEAKSGYGLGLDTEWKQLEVAMKLNEQLPLDIIPTFLGAHAVPKEYAENPHDYVSLICTDFLPNMKPRWEKFFSGQLLPFVDVFCERGAFDINQTRQILETAKSLGFPLKMHADEFENLGGVPLAVELRVVSVDHLVKTSKEDITLLSNSNTVAVSLPCTPFGLAETEYTPIKDMIDADCLVAIASDLNPGTAWCGNMQFVIGLACRYMKMTPAQAVAAATINAAAALNAQDRIGAIEPGKQADMIVLSVPDYRQLPYRFGVNLVDTIIKKGVAYKRGEI